MLLEMFPEAINPIFVLVRSTWKLMIKDDGRLVSGSELSVISYDFGEKRSRTFFTFYGAPIKDPPRTRHAIKQKITKRPLFSLVCFPHLLDTFALLRWANVTFVLNSVWLAVTFPLFHLMHKIRINGNKNKRSINFHFIWKICTDFFFGRHNV